MGNGAMSGGMGRRGRREKGQHAASLPGTANLWVQPAGHSHAGTYARGARTDSRANASGTQGRAALLGQAVGTRGARVKRATLFEQAVGGLRGQEKVEGR